MPPIYQSNLEHLDAVRQRDYGGAGAGTQAGPDPAPIADPAGLGAQESATGGVGSAGSGIAPPKLSGPATPGKLFEPLHGQIGQTSREVTAAGQRFAQEAGARRTYDSIGGSGTIQSYIQQGGSQDPVRSLLSARYGGPQALDSGLTGRISQSLGELGTFSQRAGTGAGASTLIRQSTPGLTGGQVRFEAQRILRDPSFQRQADEFQRSVQRIGASLQNEERRARDLAAARTAEESEIAEKSRSALETAKTGIEEGIAGRVGEERARAQSIRDAYDRLLKEKDLGALDSLPEGALGFDPAGFDTPGRQLSGEAQRRFDAIMAKYPEIDQVPLMELGISGHGREKLRFNQEWWKDNKQRYRGKDRRTLRQQVKERQKELEREGFAQKTTRSNLKTPSEKKQTEGIAGASPKIGQFSPVKDIYFQGEGEDFTPADIEPFLFFDPGVAATPENLASEDERVQFNRIAEVLDLAQRLEEAGVPFALPEIGADTEAYRHQEDLALKERGEAAKLGAEGWRRGVRRARSRYREEKNRGEWFKMGGVPVKVVSVAPGGKRIGERGADIG